MAPTKYKVEITYAIFNSPTKLKCFLDFTRNNHFTNKKIYLWTDELKQLRIENSKVMSETQRFRHENNNKDS